MALLEQPDQQDLLVMEQRDQQVKRVLWDELVCYQ